MACFLVTRGVSFRVIWIGQIGSTESNHVGVFGLDPDKNIWHVQLPEGEPSKPLDDAKPPADSKPPKK